MNASDDNTLGGAVLGLIDSKLYNGVPTQEEKHEVEELITEKFCGADAAGRFVLAFNDSKENGVDYLQPKNKTTRGQVATILQRVDELIK